MTEHPSCSCFCGCDTILADLTLDEEGPMCEECTWGEHPEPVR